MFEPIIHFFSNFPHPWAVFFLSMLPVTELRAAVPIGLLVYHMRIPITLFMAIAGTMVPTLLILVLLPKIHAWVREQPFLGSYLVRKMDQAERDFSGRYKVYGSIAIVVLVSLPIPLIGGAWTGALLAFIFNMPFRKSAPLIFLGVCIMALLVTALTLGVSGAVKAF